jgi:hypothetical protein
MMSRSNKSARTAMALNNVGVTMLEQGHFHDALQLFQDALLVTQVTTAVPSSSGVDHPQDPQEMDTGMLLLQSARSQLVQQQQQGRQQTQQAPFEKLQICPCDDGDVADMKNVLECVSAFVPIRLRSREFYDPQEHQQQPQQEEDSSKYTKNMEDESNNTNSTRGGAAMMMVMILYNQGLAYLLAHVQDKLKLCNDHHDSKNLTSSSFSFSTGTTTKEYGQAMLLRGAVECFSTAHALIQDHLTKHFDNSFETLWILYVLAMVHKTLMWLSRLNHQDLQALHAREMLSRVLLAIHNCQEYLQALNIKTSNQAIASAA